MDIEIKKKCVYEFDTDQNGFPTFTKKNLEFLNAILHYDSPYSVFSDEMTSEYRDSYAGIFESEDFFDFPASESLDECDELGNPVDDLYRAIVSLDTLNSTHLSSEGKGGGNKGRAKVAAKIREYGGKNLKNALEKGDIEIVGMIADRNVGGKHNFSFASKFCAYASLHALKKDNYCIYDEILQSILPYYAWMYVDDPKIDCTILYKRVTGKTTRNESLVYQYKEKGDYKAYRELIDAIIAGIKNKIGVEISYADFDHMLWYYFKGSKSKILGAMECLPYREVARRKRKSS